MYQNPYTSYQPFIIPQQIPQMPQIPQSVIKQGISGRTVKSSDEIAPSEVPMDGTIAFFPTQDGSTIFAKGWNTDGTISTIEYAPVARHSVDSEDDMTMPSLLDISNQLDDIRDILQHQKQSISKRTATKKGKNDDAE